ncbi:MAG: tRNA (adenosine(37)-N6)-dimethylallyltransferase MiaA, partial [Victivallaceae bacterium]
MENKTKIIVITAPTATGKTNLAVNLAARLDGEIISVDSRQVYRFLDLGTGKDLAEYEVNGHKIPYHLIDIESVENEYHLAAFCRDAKLAVADISRRGKLPILCGGSTMYLDALLNNYELPGTAPDLEFRAELDRMSLDELNTMLQNLDEKFYASFKERTNHNRLRRAIEICRFNADAPSAPIPEKSSPNQEYDPLIIGLYLPREQVRKNIELRLDARLAAGMIEEVKNLHEVHHISYERLERLGLEYREISRYLTNAVSYDEMRTTL